MFGMKERISRGMWHWGTNWRMWRYRDHTTPLRKGFSNQRTTWSSQREINIVITTLNGLPRSWDSFFQEICARRKLISFNRVREECAHEESRLVTREEKMGATNDQALVVYTRKNLKKKENFHHNKNEDKMPKKTKIDISNIQCYTCDEKGHLARDCTI